MDDDMSKVNGFTLIEIVATLVLVGIMAVGMAYFLIPGIQGYLLAQENAQLTQKVELAMARMSRELRECYTCYGTQGSISLPFSYENTLGNRTIVLNNGQLQINGYTLMDHVQSAAADILTRFSTDPLGLKMELDIAHQQGGGTLTFTTNVFPRNTYQ